MYRFARTKQPGQCMDQGLWSWSRHPNYFGEISFWFALGLFGLAASPADWWWVFIGTIAMAGALPRREHPDDGAAQPRAASGVPGRDRPGAQAGPASPAGQVVTRARVVIAGLGDTGLLTARHLSRHVDVVGISTKPALVSGQELGMRLARPDGWAREYLVGFDRYRKLDGVRTVHGTLTQLSLADRVVRVRLPDGSTRAEPYDVLVIATGVTNGFWRRPDLQSRRGCRRGAQGTARPARSRRVHQRHRWGSGCGQRRGEPRHCLAGHAGRALLPARACAPATSRTGLDEGRGDPRGTWGLAPPGPPRHRPDGFDLDRITTDPVAFSTGQPDAQADATLWAIGKVRPNTDWLPDSLLDEAGFVRVSPDLTVPGAPGVFAIGDVAATDPLRGSARNRADRLLAGNIRRQLAGRPLRSYRANRRRWGSVLGYQPDGLRVFTPSGRSFRFPAWSIQTVLRPWIVRRGIYGGVRRHQ